MWSRRILSGAMCVGFGLLAACAASSTSAAKSASTPVATPSSGCLNEALPIAEEYTSGQTPSLAAAYASPTRLFDAWDQARLDSSVPVVDPSPGEPDTTTILCYFDGQFDRAAPPAPPGSTLSKQSPTRIAVVIPPMGAPRLYAMGLASLSDIPPTG